MWLWAAALGVLALGVGLMVVAVNRQPPLVQRPHVLPAPTPALPTVPPGLPAGAQLQPGVAGSFPGAAGNAAAVPAAQAMPGGVPGALPPGGIPGGMAPGGATLLPAAAPAAATPAPTATPPVADTLTCRKAIRFEVEPEEAVVTINGEVIGRARRFAETKFEFAEAGVYFVRISAPRYADYWCRVEVNPDAEKETRTLKVKLANEQD